jgi:hypothetical protein
MIKGYKKLRTVEAGSLIRFQDGTYAMVSEYHTGGKAYRDSYLLCTGEFCHADSEEWVAIIDLAEIEVEALEESEYPTA